LIPVSEPVIGDPELELVTRCVKSGWVSSNGPYVEEFEDGWASRCGSRYGVAVSSGTAALELALAVIGVEPGDEVIMPSLTIISCALAAIRLGAVPVLVDADPTTWCLDVHQLEGAIRPRTKAIMPVHLFGHPVQMDVVLELADRCGLVVVEDAAEAHGARYQSFRSTDDGSWHHCGSMGDIGAFSFYANKPITTGEGGMLTTDRADLRDRARSLRDLAHDPNRRFRHEELGYNARLSNLQAALGVAQLQRLDDILAAKRSISQFYAENLGGEPDLQLAWEAEWAQSSFWMFGVVHNTVVNEAAIRRFAELGVETRPFFLGLHEQPALAGRFVLGSKSFTVTEHLSRHGLYLPSGPGLAERELHAVARAARLVFDAS
jgi:perosamine synthetase